MEKRINKIKEMLRYIPDVTTQNVFLEMLELMTEQKKKVEPVKKVEPTFQKKAK